MRRVTALPLVCRERVPPRRLTVHRRFDPRSRAGSDQLAGLSSQLRDFDPRSRAGERHERKRWSALQTVSIRAPLRGATQH
jgi:hypothetical protein